MIGVRCVIRNVGGRARHAGGLACHACGLTRCASEGAPHAGEGAPHAGERGSAIVEFCYLAVLLMVPLVYIVLVVFQVQRAGYAVTQATREAARAFVTANRQADAEARAYAAAWLALRDHGIGLRPGQLHIDCGSDPCLRPGSQISVRIDTAVALPLAPPIFVDEVVASVAIHGVHEEMVDAYRTVRP